MYAGMPSARSKFKVVAGDKTNNGGVKQFGYYHDCGKSVACVRTTYPDTYGGGDEDDDESIHNIFANDAPTHLEHLVIVIEDPAWEYNPEKMRSTRFYWSNDDTKVVSSERRVPVGDRLYLPSLMMHEFGHAAGLGHSASESHLMHAYQLSNGPVIPSAGDKAAMKALYNAHQ